MHLGSGAAAQVGVYPCSERLKSGREQEAHFKESTGTEARRHGERRQGTDAATRNCSERSTEGDEGTAIGFA